MIGAYFPHRKRNFKIVTVPLHIRLRKQAMRQTPGSAQFNRVNRINRMDLPIKSWPARVIAFASVACAFGFGEVLAQAGKLGAYTGTIEVTGTQISPKVSYRARVKVNLPVSSRKADAITAEKSKLDKQKPAKI